MGDLTTDTSDTTEELRPGGERILMTGFGPFGQHSVNASWVAVQELEKIWEQREEELKPHTLQTREIPVAYSYVTRNLPQIYEECSPSLCVHVGVSPYSVIKLERHGKNQHYKHPDVDRQIPADSCCVEDGPETITTRFNLEGVCKSLSAKEMKFDISEDAGRYLCDFIYYKSLHLGKCPVVFVHVPPLDQPYTSSELGQALKDLLEVLLAEMSSTAV